MKKILLVNPFCETKYPQPPLGLAMIAAVLEDNGYPVKILDLTALCSSGKTLRDVIFEEKPNVVGITALTPDINEAIKTANEIKKIDASILVILGGAHATVLSEETLRDAPSIDYVVRGEGEQTMLELLNVLEENRITDLSQVFGITYRTGSYIRSNPDRRPILDLDSLPFPAFHLLPMEKYRLHPPFGQTFSAIPIITSRGCPYRCIFCSKSVFGRKYCANSADYVVDEIELLVEKFGVKEIKFYDDVFTLDKKRVISICNRLKEHDLDIMWTCETRVNLVNENLLKVMKDSGCYMVEYGVESGNQKILNNLRKDLVLEQVVDAFKLTKKVGMETLAYFIIGSPGETVNTIKDTIQFAKSLDPDFVQFSMATPYPGTAFYDFALKEGNLPLNWEKYVYANLKSSGFPVFETELLSAQELKVWVKEAYKSFYLRPRYVFKKLKKTKSFGELKMNVAGLLMFLEANGSLLFKR